MVDPIEMVDLDYQRDCCLTERFSTCPVYMQATKSPLPPGIRVTSNRLDRTKPLARKMIVGVAILIFALITFFILFSHFVNPLIPVSGSRSATDRIPFLEMLSNLAGSPTEDRTEAPMMLPVVPSENMQATTPTEKLDQPQTEDVVQIPSSTAQLTPTPFATSIPLLRELDVPIGPAEKFIIHQVKIGESIGQYASTYQTSVETILQVNCGMLVPLWMDAYLVIPLDSDNPAGLPCLEPYQVIAESISAEELAEELDTDPDRFIYYNEITPGERLKAGEWLLIPKVAPVK